MSAHAGAPQPLRYSRAVDDAGLILWRPWHLGARRVLEVAGAGLETMEFIALFVALTIAMLVAWLGTRPFALLLFAAVLAASIGTYLHHATDVLKLSF